MSASLVWQKLDKKFTGNQYFKHRVLILGPKSERYKKFIELRKTPTMLFSKKCSASK